MKKVFLIMAAMLIVCSPLFGQIESGDKEVSFLGYFSTFVGDDVEANGFGSVQISYGKYYSKYFQAGFAPTFSFATITEDGEPKVDVQISGSFFFNLNFAAASKTIPYITGRYYQYTFDIPEGGVLTDYAYVTVGGGIKSFFNEYAAFNTMVTYGFSLREEAEGGIVMIMTGLSFIF
ncbi:hypothetical protein JXO52_17300 [bacterium]|nr:hypothetical protein [bacterium]